MSYSYQIKYGLWPLDACNGTPATVYSDVASPTIGTRIYSNEALTTPWTQTGGSGVYFVDTQYFGVYPVAVAIAPGPTYELGEIMLIYPNTCQGEVVTGLTYDYTFTGMDGTPYTVELYKDGSTSYKRVLGATNPFVVTYDVDTKYKPIRGSGCDINLFSEASMEFIDLYTTDIFGCKIKFYSGSTLIWNGYLTSELYSEPFNEKNNYEVSLTGNDGLALLDRLDFFDENGDPYEGFYSLWTIITDILKKLNIEWNMIYVMLSTDADEVSEPFNSCLFENVYIQGENFYDEDGAPMTCREVLESILQPFGAYIQIINNNLYITDMNVIANATISPYKRYNSAFVFQAGGNIDTRIGDVSAFKFAAPDQTLNIVSPINKQKITFSSYDQDKIIDGFKPYTGTKNIFGGTATQTNKGTNPYTWVENAYQWANEWTSSMSNSFVELVGTGDNDGVTDAYIKHVGSWPIPSIYALSFTGNILPIIPYFLDTEHPYYWLKIDMQGCPVTTYNLGGESEEAVNRVRLSCNLTIGDKSWNGSAWVAASTSTVFEMDFTKRRKTDEFQGPFIYVLDEFQDEWIQGSKKYVSNWRETQPLYVPLWGFNGNDLTFGIKDYIAEKGVLSSGVNGTEVTLKEFRLKNIILTVVDNLKQPVGQKDIEYISYLDKNVKDDGDDITMKIGTNFNHVPTSRAGILKFDGTTYEYTLNFTREGVTDYLENLLSRSIKSNYLGKTLEITCTTNIIPDIFGSITYANHLPNYTFAILGAEINYAEATTKLRLQEVNIDGTFDYVKNYID